MRGGRRSLGTARKVTEPTAHEPPRRLPSKLAAHQRKLLSIDEHMGVCISGLTADARSLCK